jgi:hypothetical protein
MLMARKQAYWVEFSKARRSELLSKNYLKVWIYLYFIGHEEETKVLELDDQKIKRETTMKVNRDGNMPSKPAGISDKSSSRQTTKGDMEYYKKLEEENERKLFGDKKGMDKADSVSTSEDKCNELKNQMNQNLQALNERGDKIEQLQDKR